MMKKLPAIPPDDYKGTIADWITGLQERGFFKVDEFDYCDLEIDEDIYWELLEKCEVE